MKTIIRPYQKDSDEEALMAMTDEEEGYYQKIKHQCAGSIFRVNNGGQ